MDPDTELPALFADTLGWIHYLRGEYATAKPLLERAAERSPRVGEIQLHAAFMHAAVGEPAKARERLDAALKLDPSLGEREDVKALAEKLRGGGDGAPGHPESGSWNLESESNGQSGIWNLQSVSLVSPERPDLGPARSAHGQARSQIPDPQMP